MSEILELLEFKADKLYKVIQPRFKTDEELQTFDDNGTLLTWKKFDALKDKEIFLRIYPKVREIEIRVDSPASLEKALGMIRSVEHKDTVFKFRDDPCLKTH